MSDETRLELVATAPGTAELREYDVPEVEADQLRVESEYSSFKHGTGLRMYRADTRDNTAAFDWEKRLHVEGQTDRPSYPIGLGNRTVGRVTEVGSDVERLAVGDRVYGALPIRETHVVAADAVVAVPEEMPVEALAYADPARVGLHAVRVAGVGVGDSVAVFGAGAIGQMAVQIAGLAGARTVAVSEPIDRRRNAAGQKGADCLVDPTGEDPGARLKDELSVGGEPGVDAAIETSGAYPALSDAIRATAYGGVVASCGYYTGSRDGLALEGEWHRNRLDVRSVRPPSEPLRDHPRWDYDRLDDEAFALLREGRLSATGLVDPVVSIERAVEGIELIDTRPEQSIKLCVRYD